MVDYWLLGDLLAYALLLIVAFIWLKGFLTFLNSLAEGVSFYVTVQNSDVNTRSAAQSEYLANFVAKRDAAVRVIVFSTLVGAVILFARHLMEVIHAAV